MHAVETKRVKIYNKTCACDGSSNTCSSRRYDHITPLWLVSLGCYHGQLGWENLEANTQNTCKTCIITQCWSIRIEIDHSVTVFCCLIKHGLSFNCKQHRSLGLRPRDLCCLQLNSKPCLIKQQNTVTDDLFLKYIYMYMKHDLLVHYVTWNIFGNLMTCTKPVYQCTCYRHITCTVGALRS